MPLVMAGSIALLLNNVVFSPGGLIADQFNLQESAFFVFSGQWISPALGIVDSGTLSIFGAALAFTIAYLRGVNENQDALVTGTIALGAFIILGALTRQNETVAPWVGHYLGRKVYSLRFS